MTADHDATPGWTLAAIAPREIGDIDNPAVAGEPWPLVPNRPIGQMLRPRHDGLCAIELHLAQHGSLDAGCLRAELRQDGPAGSVVGVAMRSLQQIAQASVVRLSFPPVHGSGSRTLCLWLSVDSPGLALATTGPGGSGAWRDDQPAATGLAVRTFAAEPDARWADRLAIEHLLRQQADLTGELIATRQALQRMTDERGAIERRLRQLLARLMSLQEGQARDGQP